MTVFIEAEEAFFSHQCLHGGRVGHENIQFDPIMLLYFVDKGIGFRVQAPGIKTEDMHMFGDFGGHVDEHHVLSAAERNGNVLEIGIGVVQDLYR